MSAYKIRCIIYSSLVSINNTNDTSQYSYEMYTYTHIYIIVYNATLYYRYTSTYNKT